MNAPPLLVRAAQALVTLLLVTLAIFVIVRVVGDPTHLMLPPEASDEDRALLRAQLGLDRPVAVQFALYLGQIARGDFGYSYRFSEPALSVVADAVGPTVELTLAAMMVALVIGLPLGVLAAANRNGLWDQFGRLVAVTGQSAPPFLFSLLLLKLFAIRLGWLPTGGMGGWRHLVLPAAALGWYCAGTIARLTRAQMVATLQSEYVRFARIKGLSKLDVLLNYALLNALAPILTFTTLQVGYLLGGAVTVEVIFAWPGVGQLIVESISSLDYPVVQAVVILAACVFIVLNLIVDLLYVLLDPRLRAA